MRYVRSHPRLRWLARLLAFAMLAPYVAWGPAAHAQRSNPDVYVLDFNNKTTVGGTLLGRVAAAQVSLQLSESANWQVIPESQVQQAIQALSLKPPFDRVNRVQIADRIDASAIIFGNITEAAVTGGATPQAKVRLQVLVEDRATGVLINGAMAEAFSTPRMGYTGDSDILLEEALGKAAFKAREYMDRFRLPEGTVLNTLIVGSAANPRTDALINIGTRQGARVGMHMIVTRQGAVVGRVKITEVDSDISTANVLEAPQGIRPEDRVRAIFSFGDFPNTRTKMNAVPAAPARLAAQITKDGPETGLPTESTARVTRAPKSSVFELARAPQEAGTRVAQATVQPPPPVIIEEPEIESDESSTGGRRGILSKSVLRMAVGGLLLMGVLAVGGRGGNNATRATTVDAYGYQLDQGAPGAFIKICWDRPKAVKSSQVLQYVIYRASELGEFRIVGAHDTDTNRCFTDNEATRDVTAFDDPPGDVAGGRNTILAVPGIQPGTQYRYQVATVYRNGLEDRDNDGEPDEEDYISPLSMSSPWATAITPPIVLSPVQGEQVDLTDLKVTWQQTPGANQYFIWVSKDARFRKNSRLVFGPYTVLPVDQGGDPTVTRTVDAFKSRLAGARNVHIAVGARNSSDGQRPRPFGAFFGPGVAVVPLVVPPGPPGSGGSSGVRTKRDNQGIKEVEDGNSRGGKRGKGK